MSTPANPPPNQPPQQSQHSTAATSGFGIGSRRGGTRARRVSTETKAAYKTTEFVFYILAVIGVFIASAVVDEADADNLTGFDAHQAWALITWLTIGYMISRGLAKSGSREPYDDTDDND